MRRFILVLIAACVFALLLAGTAAAAPSRSHDGVAPHDPVPKKAAPEIAVPPYVGYTYYSAIEGILASWDKRSAKLSVKMVGTSANNNQLYLATLTWPWQNKGLKKRNMDYRNTLLKNPSKAKAMLTSRSGIRAPVFINASIHGGETTGVDASLRLIKYLAFTDNSETRRILKNSVVLINVCQNPDGRITDLRANGNGFDVNRDFITLTQPEAKITQGLMKKYLPVSFLDLHGYVDPMLIEPCTIPHNPNLEYDLFIKWALPMAESMKAKLEAKTGLTAQIPYQWGTGAGYPGEINEGWDDYGPYYTPMLAQEYGSIGVTMETASKTVAGVDSHYWTSLDSINYVIKNRLPMMRDQARFFVRGDKGIVSARPWMGNMEDMIDPMYWLPTDPPTPDPDFPYSNDVGVVDFPYAYIIPVDSDLQKDRLAAYKGVNHLFTYGVEVMKAKATFSADGTLYPAGTYIVRTQQPLRSLANNILWNGENVAEQYGVGAMYDISAWSLPEIWGFDCVDVSSAFSASTAMVTKTQKAMGDVVGDGPYFAFDGNSNAAIMVVNAMLQRHFTVYMVNYGDDPAGVVGEGGFIIDTADAYASNPRAYLDVASLKYGVTFWAPDEADIPTEAMWELTVPNAMVNVDNNTIWALKNYLGFATVASGTAPTSSTSAFLNSSTNAPTAALVAPWLDGASSNRQRTYIGIAGGTRATGIPALLPGVAVSYDPSSRDNGIVNVAYDQDSVYTAGYPESDYAFAYPPYWFTLTASEAEIDVTYENGASGAGPFFSGFWVNDNAAAVGEAAMVDGMVGEYGHAVFFGFHPTYRGMQDNTLIPVARALLLSRATPPTPPVL